MNKSIKIALLLAIFSSLQAQTINNSKEKQNIEKNEHNNKSKNLLKNSNKKENYKKILTGKKDVDELVFKLIKTKEALDALEKQREEERRKRRSQEEIEREKEKLEQKKYDREKRESLKELERLEHKIQIDKRKKELEDKNDLIVSEKLENVKLLVDYNLLQIKYLKDNINKTEKIKVKSKMSFGNKTKYSIDKDEYDEKIAILLENKDKLQNLNNKEEQLLLLTSIVKNKVLFKKELEKLNVLSKTRSFLDDEMKIETNDKARSIYGTNQPINTTNQGNLGILEEKNYIYVSDLEENPNIEIKQYPEFIILEIKK